MPTDAIPCDASGYQSCCGQVSRPAHLVNHTGPERVMLGRSGDHPGTWTARVFVQLAQVPARFADEARAAGPPLRRLRQPAWRCRGAESVRKGVSSDQTIFGRWLILLRLKRWTLHDCVNDVTKSVAVLLGLVHD